MNKILFLASISSYLISEGKQNISSCDSVETATMIKHVTEYEQMQKRMVEFVGKFQGHGIKNCSI